MCRGSFISIASKFEILVSWQPHLVHSLKAEINLFDCFYSLQLWWLPSSQAWAIVCSTVLCVLSLSTKLNVNFSNFFKLPQACLLRIIYRAFCVSFKAMVFLCDCEKLCHMAELKILILITSSHGSPRLSILGRKGQMLVILWSFVSKLVLASVSHIYKKKKSSKSQYLPLSNSFHLSDI